jgi:hypothetical protein
MFMKRKQFFCNEERNKKDDIFFAVAERALLVSRNQPTKKLFFTI